MRKLSTSLAALTFLFSIGAANADEITAKITDINTDSKKITLDNGQIFSVDEDVKIEDLKEGAEVKVTYDEKDGQKTATEVSPVEK